MRFNIVVLFIGLVVFFVSCNTPVQISDPVLPDITTDPQPTTGHGQTESIDTGRISINSVLEVVGGGIAETDAVSDVAAGSTLVRSSDSGDLISAQGTSGCPESQGGISEIMQFCLTFEDTFGLDDVENLYFTVQQFDGALEVPITALDITYGELAKACFDAKLVGQLEHSEDPIDDMGKLTGVGNALGCIFYVTRGSGIAMEFRTEITEGEPCDVPDDTHDPVQPTPTTPEPTLDPVEGCEADPSLCDDDNACTEEECVPGEGCLRTHIDCDDGDECTEDACHPKRGCIHTPIECIDPVEGCEADPALCDDGNTCTIDACVPGVGCQRTPIDCDDGNSCTDETCDPVVGCVRTVTDCDDGDACTQDSCDPDTGCVNDDINCDDGDPCTDDSCDAVAGCVNQPMDCDDGDLCTVDVCVTGVGCVNTPIVCDDGNFCNGVESCDPTMGCVTTGSPCSAGQTCDEATDQCTAVSVAPTDFCAGGDEPTSITMRFAGGSCAATSHSQPTGKVDCSGLPITLPLARIIIADRSNLSSGGVRIYFDGTVAQGSTFVASAATAGETELRAEMHFFIRDPLLAFVNIQTGQFRADCEQPLFVGDRFGALHIVNVGF